jgi:beta-lactamase regulating signal transducer with metallopeptidase domain
VRIPVAWPTVPESTQADVASLAADEPTPDPTPPEQPAFVLVLPTTVEDEPAAPIHTSTVPPTPAPADPPRWPRLLPFVWLSSSLGWFVLALVRLGRFRRLLRFSRSAPAALQQRAARLARRLGLPCCPRVGLLPGRLAPMLWAGGGSPRLLVPADLLDLLGEEQLDTLLVHELAHLRRRDHWVRALEFVVMGLYWWHPVVWYARRELREAEEQCCDAWVVSTLPGAGRTYATALMDTLDFLSTARPAVPPLASGIGHVTDLKRRLTMIMRGTTPRALSWPGCLGVLAVGAFFLPMLPALQAQAPAKEDTEQDVIAIPLRDEESVQKQIEANKADLDKLKEDLKQKMEEVAKAQARLKAAVAQAHAAEEKKAKEHQARIKGDLEKAIIIMREQGAKVGDGKKPAIRIEIVVNAEGVDVKELAKKIESVLPKNARVRIESSTADLDLGKLKGILEFHEKGVFSVPHNKFYKVIPAPPVPDKPASPPGRPQEKRIDDLEKRLEKVLHELHELRKQMKDPQSSLPVAPLPAIPAPPGPVFASRPSYALPAIPPAPQPSSAPPAVSPPDAPKQP